MLIASCAWIILESVSQPIIMSLEGDGWTGRLRIRQESSFQPSSQYV